MVIDILSLFPEMFQGPFDASIIKRAREKGLVEINLVNIRDYSKNKHRTVDDTPYGGGMGMVMEPGPIFAAVEDVRARRGSKGRVILMCPTGRKFNQQIAVELAGEGHLILVCGHYEGVDERVREHLADDEISIGDYVLTGGELPAMVVVDAVVRLVPGVLGEALSVEEDSFRDGLLEYPQYTRPRDFRGYKVPEVLLSGHHEQIRQWRRRQSLLRTLARRPELLTTALLTDEDRKVLKKLLDDLKQLGLE